MDVTIQKKHSNFRGFFVRGLATLLPTILTIFLLLKCYEFVQDHIGVHMTSAAVRVMLPVADALESDYPKITAEDRKAFYEENHLEPGQSIDDKQLRKLRLQVLEDQWNRGPYSLLGFGLAIILIYFAGRILASFVGRKLWAAFERAVTQVPGFRQVYPYIKQVIDFIIGENKIEFTRVVMVPYPRKGLWSMGLVTGPGLKELNHTLEKKLLTVFIPSSPTPMTGYIVHVDAEEVIDIPISIEQALRFTISGGVIVPEHQAMPGHYVELNGNKSDGDETSTPGQT